MAETLIRSTADLVAAWRARIRELGITFATVDEIAGLPDRYTSKLMCGSKQPGGLSITLINNALGMALVSVVDEVQADRVRSKWEPRKRSLFGATHSGALLTDARQCDPSCDDGGQCDAEGKPRSGSHGAGASGEAPSGG